MPERDFLLDPVVMREVLAAGAPRFAATGHRVESVHVVQATAKLRKLLVEYRVRLRDATGRPEDRALIAKAYATDRGALTFAAMEALERAGFVADAEFAVPTPLGYLAEPRVLLQSRAPGSPLSSLLYLPGTRGSAARLAARLLARVHAAAAPPTAELRPLEQLARYVVELAASCPTHADRIASLGRELAASLPELDEAVPVHGDYHPKNVFVDGPRATVIDLDTFARGDPAADVGYFVGQTAIMAFHHYGSFGPAAPAIRAFVETCAVEDAAGAVGRAGWYVARTFLQSLHYELCVLRTGEDRLIPVWLGEVKRWLTRHHRQVGAWWRQVA